MKLAPDRHSSAEQVDKSSPIGRNALNPLRAMFDDELLVRTTTGMKPTPLASELTLVNEAQYVRLCSVLSREDLAREARFANFALRADELGAELQNVFATDTTESWLGRLQGADIIADRILTPSEWLANEHVVATRAALRTETPGVGAVFAARTPGMAGDNEGSLCPSPDVGQDSQSISSGLWSLVNKISSPTAPRR
jgi:crotonobetainyl-CoA:carnitine CoA-transferase CaiB-like acyl-CoA transferase